MMLLYRAIGALSILLFYCLNASPSCAKVNYTFADRSREHAIRINSIPWERVNTRSRAAKLDSLQDLAEQEDDDRLLWYTKSYRFLLTQPISNQPAEKISQYEALLKYLTAECPVTEVIAHFRCMYAAYCLEYNQPDKGFKALFLAKEQFESLGYENLPCSGEYLFAIGQGYYVYEDYNNCMKSLELALKFRFTKKITPVLLRNTLGMAYLKMQSYKLAEQNFVQTIRVATAIGNRAYIGIGTGNLGNTLRLAKKPAASLPYLYKSIEMNKQREPGSAAITCVYAAKSLLALDSIAKAKLFLDMSVPLSKINHSYNEVTYRRQYFEAAALYNRKIGNNRSAASYLDSTIAVKDSVRQIFNKKIVAITQWAIDAEKQRASIAEAESKKEATIKQRKVVAVVILLILIALSYALYRRHMKLLVERKIQEDRKSYAESALADATEQLNSYLKNVQEKNLLIEDINEELHQLKGSLGSTQENQERSEEIEEHRRVLLESVILTEKDWIHFQRLFDFVYPDFLENLKTKYPGLTSNETRLMVLLKLEIANKQMAFMLGVSIAAVRKSRQRLRKKLDLVDPEHELKGFVDDESLQ